MSISIQASCCNTCLSVCCDTVKHYISLLTIYKLVGVQRSAVVRCADATWLCQHGVRYIFNVKGWLELNHTERESMKRLQQILQMITPSVQALCNGTRGLLIKFVKHDPLTHCDLSCWCTVSISKTLQYCYREPMKHFVHQMYFNKTAWTAFDRKAPVSNG